MLVHLQVKGPKENFSKGVTALCKLKTCDFLVGAGDGSVTIVKGRDAEFKRTKSVTPTIESRCTMLKHPVHLLASLPYRAIYPVNIWEIYGIWFKSVNYRKFMGCMSIKVKGAIVHRRANLHFTPTFFNNFETIFLLPVTAIEPSMYPTFLFRK